MTWIEINLERYSDRARALIETAGLNMSDFDLSGDAPSFRILHIPSGDYFHFGGENGGARWTRPGLPGKLRQTARGIQESWDVKLKHLEEWLGQLKGWLVASSEQSVATPNEQPKTARQKLLEFYHALELWDEQNAPLRDALQRATGLPVESPLAELKKIVRPDLGDFSTPVVPRCKSSAALRTGSPPASEGTPSTCRQSRGRKSKFTPEQLRTAEQMKLAGRRNRDIAQVLYETLTPDAGQRRSVPTILKYHGGKEARDR